MNLFELEPELEIADALLSFADNITFQAWIETVVAFSPASSETYSDRALRHMTEQSDPNAWRQEMEKNLFGDNDPIVF